MNKMTIAIILGTRPEIIKLAPIIRELEQQNGDFTIVHTGQHYSDDLDGIFFDDLNIPKPDFNLEIGSGSQSKQTGEMMVELGNVLKRYNLETVIVQGDTNSALSGGLVASKLDAELAHVEAGLRSGDRTMPEEINRILIDHCSDYLFPPTEESGENLIKEGIPKNKIYVTGNTIVDAVRTHLEISKQTSHMETTENPSNYILLTAHRKENVDSRKKFSNILDGVNRVAEYFDYDVVYPIHPRGKKRIDEFELTVPNRINLIEPTGYLKFLQLQEKADLIITDSGGVQEEACILGTPCVTVRDSTERPETIKIGSNQLAGTNPEEIVSKAKDMIRKKGEWENPFGDGTAAKQILKTIS